MICLAKTMKALMKTGAKVGAELREVPVPSPGAGEVLIKVQAAAICGTDGHIYEWDAWAASRIRPPMIFGHEFSGHIHEKGPGVENLEKGDFVSAEGHFTCGQCFFCRTGQGHICQDVEIIGVDTQGCFAEYVLVPKENVWKVDPSIPADVASIHDPVGNAIHATLMDEIIGNTVLVTGCGPIGLAAIAVCRMAGARKVIATEVNPYRLNLARTMGAHITCNPTEVDVVEEVLKETQGLGADVLLEMAGKPQAIDDGFKALRKGGWVSLLGLAPDRVEMDINDGIIFKGARVYGINGRLMYHTWYKMQSLLTSGLDMQPLITHSFSFEDYEEAFDLVLSGNCGKVILYP